MIELHSSEEDNYSTSINGERSLSKLFSLVAERSSISAPEIRLLRARMGGCDSSEIKDEG